MTLREAKQIAANELQLLSPTAALDVNCLLEHILKCDKTFLLLHANDTLTQEQESDFRTAIERRKTGLPIAYITNRKEFYGYDFFVTPDVLIPKPDTEILVENAVDGIIEKITNPNVQSSGESSSPMNRQSGDRRLKICDMCTGSGCIGIAVYLSLKEKLPENKLPEITFVDINDAALEIAKKNAERLAPECLYNYNKENYFSPPNTVGDEDTNSSLNRGAFHFIKSNLFENVPDTFDFILTNPPYIPSRMVDELLRDGRNEPRLALDGDAPNSASIEQNPTTPPNSISSEKSQSNGLGLIRHLIPQMKNHLNPNGVFFMETGEYNAEKAAKLCEDAGFKNVKIIRDLEEQLRVIYGN